jgi:hypothetical protein
MGAERSQPDLFERASLRPRIKEVAHEESVARRDAVEAWLSTERRPLRRARQDLATWADELRDRAAGLVAGSEGLTVLRDASFSPYELAGEPIPETMRATFEALRTEALDAAAAGEEARRRLPRRVVLPTVSRVVILTVAVLAFEILLDAATGTVSGVWPHVAAVCGGWAVQEYTWDKYLEDRKDRAERADIRQSSANLAAIQEQVLTSAGNLNWAGLVYKYGGDPGWRAVLTAFNAGEASELAPVARLQHLAEVYEAAAQLPQGRGESTRLLQWLPANAPADLRQPRPARPRPRLRVQVLADAPTDRADDALLEELARSVDRYKTALRVVNDPHLPPMVKAGVLIQLRHSLAP